MRLGDDEARLLACIEADEMVKRTTGRAPSQSYQVTPPLAYGVRTVSYFEVAQSEQWWSAQGGPHYHPADHTTVEARDPARRPTGRLAKRASLEA